MPRIRTIKPEFWSSPSMRGANPWARLLYVAMWNWADDAGRGTANVRELAAFAFPDDEDPLAPTVTELPSLLKEVAERWDVAFYEVSGRRYYAIPSFDLHQRTERKAQGRHPGPEEGTPYDPGPSDQAKHASRRNVARNATDLPSPSGGTSVTAEGSSESGTGEQGNRGTGELPAGGVDQLGPGESRARTREPRPLPDDWAPHDLHALLARQRGVDLEHEAEQFRAHAAAHGRMFVNAHEAFRYWLGNASTRRAGGVVDQPMRRPGPDDELTREQVDDILGPQSMPYPPAEIVAQGIEAAQAWARENDPKWHAERAERARERLRRRAAR